MKINKVRSRGFRQFAIGMAGYAVAVLAIGFAVEPESLPTVTGILLALVPMAIVIWAMVGWLRALRTFDELQQRVFTEAGLISLGLTAVITFGYGFLETYVQLPRLSMFYVVPCIGATFALTLPFVQKRFS